MPYYAVVDTNVLVSALLAKHPDSSPVRIMDFIFAQEIIPLHSMEILAEYAEVLKRPKFRFPADAVDALLKALLLLGESVEPLETGVAMPDAKDVVFFEVTMARQNDDAHLITGNTKHFPAVPQVVTPNEMLTLIQKGRC